MLLLAGRRKRTRTNRERRRLWSSRPGFWLAGSSVADVLIAAISAVGGIATTPLPVLAASLGAPIIQAGSAADAWHRHPRAVRGMVARSEEHTSELQSLRHL